MTTDQIGRYVLLDEYRSPKMPTGDSVRGTISAIWNRILKSPDPEADIEADRGLRHLPASIASDLHPTLSMQDDIDQLHQLVERTSSDGASCTVVVSPAGEPFADTCEAWAQRENACVLRAPQPHELLVDAAVPDLDEDLDQTIVIPSLHRHFLRHPNGLASLRRLLSILHERQRCVIGCDSWAWAYLRTAVQIDTLLPTPYTLEPLDGKRLLRRLAEQYDNSRFDFRFVNDESSVLESPKSSSEPKADDRSDAQREFSNLLAATARGIPNVASQLWTHCLRAAKDEQKPTPTDKAPRNGDPRVFWVQPTALHELPLVKASHRRFDVITLHLLLVHGGLSKNVLPELVPVDRDNIVRSLFTLKKIHVVADRDGIWSVCPLAYPSVRDLLCDEGFLIDDI